MSMLTSEFIALHRTDDVRRLALAAVPDGVDLPYALQQIEGWQTAYRKLPTWAATEGIVFPPRLALEQCSSEATAQLKVEILRGVMAEGVAGASLTDLTGGYGVDFLTLATAFGSATYVERQAELAMMVRHNSELLPGCRGRGGRMHFHVAEAEAFMQEMEPVDVIYMDPARRDSVGRKVALIEDCQPDVCALLETLLSRCRYCLIKLSPMLDITAAVRRLQHVAEVHVVSLHGECKEVLLLLSATAHEGEEPVICCHYSDSSASGTFGKFVFRPSEEREASNHIQALPKEEGVLPLWEKLEGGFLYEPDAALLKGGCFRTICQRYPVHKLATDTHLYVADTLIPDFPGRTWRIEAQSSFAKRELRAMLGGIRSAEIAIRNFPVNVATLRRQLRLADGHEAHLIATTLADGTHRLLKVKAKL